MSEINENDALHCAEQLAEVVQDVTSTTGYTISDEIMKCIEGLIALYINLNDATTWSQISSATFLYVRSHFSQSVSGSIMSYFREETRVVEDQNGEETCSDTPTWLKFFRNIREHWELCLECKLFKQFSKLMGVCVVAGLCKASDVSFDIGNFRIFAPAINAAHTTAKDVIDAIIGTVTIFSEGMYMSFKTKSFKPLLMNNHELIELDEEYNNIMSWWPLVKVGNLERIAKISDHEFNNRASALGLKFKNLVPALNGLEKKLISDKILKLAEIENDLVAMKIASGLRKAPFAVELTGGSHQGKTTLCDLLIDAMLTSRGLPLGDKYRASVKAGDRFDSTWSSDKLVMIMDDVANEKPNTVEKSPTRAIIDVCNNQMTYANIYRSITSYGYY